MSELKRQTITLDVRTIGIDLMESVFEQLNESISLLDEARNVLSMQLSGDVDSETIHKLSVSTQARIVYRLEQIKTAMEKYNA